MMWGQDNPMLDKDGKPTERHKRYGTGDCQFDRWAAHEDVIGRLQVRVTALESLWERVAKLEQRGKRPISASPMASAMLIERALEDIRSAKRLIRL